MSLGSKSLLPRLAIGAVLSPLFAVYGAWCVACALWQFTVGTFWWLRLLRRSLPCPSCGFENDLASRWACRCGAVYHGVVTECAICGESATFFPCVNCHISIRLRGRP